MKLKGLAVSCVIAVAVIAAALRIARAEENAADGAAQAASADTPQRTIDFNRDIRPILSDNCYYCHGPDPSHRKADLRLDTKEGLFAVKDDVAAVVPGNLDDSILYLRITSDDEEFVMPHADSNKKLTEQQKDLLKQWIEQGAPWEGHWAYVPPKPTTAPAVQIEGFTRNPIDQFVGAKLNEAGLVPSPEADRVTLIRRLSFDLTGLPPKPAEVEAFVNDASSDAYEKLVDRLLASPHYGERMSVFWMDLVRYADTIGFHSDNPREVWPYRDWLIKAFNQNKPFDQFTIEQIAGDLLPNATRDQKVASAYNRLLLTTGEGGAQAKEYVKKYEGDRVRNVSTVWMGVTMGCAQCHDHKFDPFTTKDFYRMAAFFADIQEPAIALPQPELALPTPEQEAELGRLAAAVAETQKRLEVSTPEILAAQAAWEERYHQEKDQVKWHPVEIAEITSENGAAFTISANKRTVLVAGSSPAKDTYDLKAVTKVRNVTGIKLEVLPHKSLPQKGPGRAGNGNFVLTEIDVRSVLGDAERPVTLSAASASHEQTAFADGNNPYRRWPAIATNDGDKYGDNWGWAILDKAGQAHHVVYETAYDVDHGENELVLKLRLKQNLGDQHTIGHFRLFVTDSERPIRAAPDKNVPPAIVKLLNTPADKRTDAQKGELAAHYRTIDPSLQPIRDELTKLTQDLLALNQQIPRTLTSVSGPPRVTRVLHRGDWQDETGEVVAPGVPEFMRQIEVPVERGPTRLDLANWLVARDNPLTARVLVNRLWKTFYGEGLAKPLDDLGAQGQWPTHPELLDFLAVQLIENDWDLKAMIRLMVTSGTYRQSSNQSRELREKDPYNKWLARQASFRLDAEFVRDNALAISGLLSPKMFGPSVKPYQPEGYWEFLNFPKRQYEQDTGESLYRRGLYTWWQRTFLNPSLLNFDAPTHEECTAERVRSNTPQQALTLMNDVTYVEAARVFAARILNECNGDVPTRLTWAFRTALSRDPTPQEIPILVDLLEQQRQRYETDVVAADALITSGEAPPATGVTTGELAAWTSVARTILNLHETITRN